VFIAGVTPFRYLERKVFLDHQIKNGNIDFFSDTNKFSTSGAIGSSLRVQNIKILQERILFGATNSFRTKKSEINDILEGSNFLMPQIS